MLGGIFSEQQLRFIVDNSLGPIQNAADAFQKKILLGLDSNLTDGVSVLNLPFIGSYPRYFRQSFFHEKSSRFADRSVIIGHRFCNIFGIRMVSRLVSSLKTLFRTPADESIVLLVYSAHLPFVLSAIIFRAFRKSARTCLILPDLPEYMGDTDPMRRILKFIDIRLFYSFSKFFDYYVFLTQHMAEKLNTPSEKYVVIEGIANAEPKETSFDSEVVKTFLYTGTLAKRYGIMNLVTAFSRIEDNAASLWICGEGDSRNAIIAAAQSDDRIKYFGQVDRNTALELQSKATFLVNPRTSEGDYTKYSFPSKILEYMSTGKPVIMYKLDGIPSEYDGLYISPRGLGIDLLSACMRDALAMSHEDLRQLGAAAKAFVLLNKNPEVQAKKILKLISKES